VFFSVPSDWRAKGVDPWIFAGTGPVILDVFLRILPEIMQGKKNAGRAGKPVTEPADRTMA
jgi:hypothetical protein